MEIATAIALVVVILGSLAYTNYKFDKALKEFEVGVKATVAPDAAPTEASEQPVAVTSRLTLSQKRALLEAAAARRAEERRAR